MSVSDANLSFIYLATVEVIFLDFVLEDISHQKSNFVEKMNFDPLKFLWEKKDGYSKPERLGIIDLNPKCSFIG